MSAPSEMGKLYPVEQRHRDAAASGYFAWVSSNSVIPSKMLSGKADDHSMVQSFARFEAEHLTRIAVTPAVDREGVWAKARTAAFMLLQHSEGCAANHYGDDLSIHGMPGWLADCRKDLEAADAILALPPVKQSDGWQDIGTAPKDMLLIVYDERLKWLGQGGLAVAYHHSDFNGREGIWTRDGRCGCVMDKPELWQPLPTPPAIRSLDITRMDSDV